MYRIKGKDYRLPDERTEKEVADAFEATNHEIKPVLLMF